MLIKKFGVCLRILAPEDLEMVRKWRNLPRVRSSMQFQQHISKKDQQNWFRKLNPELNVYWIFGNEKQDLGLIHLKDIQNRNVGEAGVFTGDEAFLGTPIPAIAILVMMDVAFDILGLSVLNAKIQKGNNHNLWTNEKFGYIPLNPQSEEGFQLFQVSRPQFRKATDRLRKALIQTFGANTSIVMGTGNTGFLVDKVNRLSAEQKERFQLFFS